MITFNVDRKLLIALLSFMIREFVNKHGKRNVFPIMENILCKVYPEQKRMELKTWIQDHEISCFINIRIDSSIKDFDFIFNPKMLIICLRSYSTFEIELAYIPGEDEPSQLMVVDSILSPMVYTQSIITSEYPEAFSSPFSSSNRGFKIKGFDLEQILKTLSFSYEQDTCRSWTHGIFFDLLSDGITFVSTDGKRLSEYTSDIKPTGRAKIESFIMPHTCIRSLINRLRIYHSDQEISIKVSATDQDIQILIEGPDWAIRSRALDATYPDYHRVIPESFIGECEIACLDLLTVTEFIQKFSNKKNQLHMKLVIDGDSISISNSRNLSIGCAIQQKIQCLHHTGPGLKITLNPLLLSQFLKLYRGQNIKLQYGDVLKPALFSASENHKYIIMPCRLYDE